MKGILHNWMNNWQAFFLLGIGLLFCTLPIVGFNFEFLPGDLGDGRFNMFILEHGYQFLSFQLDSYWSAPFMYPEENVITISDNLLGMVPVYSFFRMLGAERETAFQCFFIATTCLSFLFSYKFFKFLLKNASAAAIGAFVFAFSLSYLPDYAHAQMWSRYAVPLAFWGILLFYQEKSFKRFFIALLGVVYCFYCSIYLGFLILLPASIILGVAIVKEFKKISAKKYSLNGWIGYLIAGAINLLLLLLIMYPYFLRSITSEKRLFVNVVESIPVWKSFLFAGNGSLWYTGIAESGYELPAFWDHQIAPGFIALFSLVLCFGFLLRFVVRRIQKREKTESTQQSVWLILGISALATFLCYIRVQDISLYAILFKLPGFSAMRSLTRIINVETIFFASAVALVFLRINQKITKMNWLFFIGFAALVVLDNYRMPEAVSRSTKIEHVERRMAVMKKLKGLPNGTIISYEPKDLNASDANNIQLDAMTATQELNLKCVNGYSATAPGYFGVYWSNPTSENRMIWLNYKKCTEKIIVIE